MQKIFRALLIASLTTFPLIPLTSVWGQDKIQQERIQFEPGTNSSFVEDSITGYEIVDYVLGAKEGQYMNVSMATDNTSNYFNILAPDENEVAMFNSSMSENQYEGVLPKSGDYKIRVYLMRNAARRDEVAHYRLEMIIGEAEEGQSPTASDRPNDDALVGGTNYNATGTIPCAMVTRQPTSFCDFGVIREGNGTGTVTVTKPDGNTRSIFFENGEATGYDKSEADSEQFSAEKQNDLNFIDIGQERYEIPDAVIFGG